jgi:dihydropteroate synthase
MDRLDSRVRYLHFASTEDAVAALKGMAMGPNAMQEILPMMVHLNIMLEGVESGAATIIKQEMLSVGGEAVVASGSGGHSLDEKKGIIIMGTLKQIHRFTEKCSGQSCGLKAISKRIDEILNNISLDSVPLRTSRRTITIGNRTLIMGILNVTPDSFSDGGRFTVPEMAVEEGVRMAEEGADMIDIGGESSRPGSEPVPVEEELRRVIPVVRGLAKRVDIPLSVDTMKARVAGEALAEGAEIVNDISSLDCDANMAKAVADAGAAVILMHMRGTPKTMQTGDLTYTSLRGEIIAYLQKRIKIAWEKGIEPEQMMVDPGLGFGKTAMDNVRLIKHLGELKVLGRPIVTGASRKSFIGHVTGAPPQERLEGTAAAVTVAILNGSRIIRVHDVAAMKKVAAMADAINEA